MIPPSFEKGGVTLNQSLFSGFIVADTPKLLGGLSVLLFTFVKAKYNCQKVKKKEVAIRSLKTTFVKYFASRK
jgi:hypothetical protein